MRRWIPLAACALAIACGGSSPAGPEPRVISGVTWTATTWLRVGQQSQLTVTAHWSDGSSSTSPAAQWTSLAPGIVSLTPGGLATAQAEGLANLTVQIEGRTWGGQILVLPADPKPVTVDARVQMVAPSEHIVFPGLPVRIRSTSHYPFDSTLTTDASGRLFVTLEAGRYVFEARPAGDYFPAIAFVTVLEDMRLAIAVRPGAGAAIETLTVPRGAPPVSQVSAEYPVHGTGALSFGLLRACFDGECAAPAADVCAEVRDPDNRLLAQVRLPVGSARYQGTPTIQGGRIITVKAYPCASGTFAPAPGVVFRELSLEVRRPK